MLLGRCKSMAPSKLRLVRVRESSLLYPIPLVITNSQEVLMQVTWRTG